MSHELGTLARTMPARYINSVLEVLTSPRRTLVLIFCAFGLSSLYVLSTFAIPFLLGAGPFWANPQGPWLRDAADSISNSDVLNLQIGYVAFLHTNWHVPVFLVHNIGPPPGTNIIFLDAIPAVALLGKLAAGLTGGEINPYGMWVAACFILSAIFATLLVVEAGQRSLLAAAAASVLVVTAPPLLHRFGHLSLMAHFLVIGALFFYLLDRRIPAFRSTCGRWTGMLGIAALVHIYILAMAGAIYGASFARRWRASAYSFRATGEPFAVLSGLAALMLIAGHFGPGTGTDPSARGFGQYSMNLASPFWPQRSGLFPGFSAILDATTGQYEGFNYLGFGALIIVVLGVSLNLGQLRTKIVEHWEFCGVLGAFFLFALSNRIFLGNLKLLDLDYSGRLDQMLGVFRSSGRMFWPVFYAVLLFGLIGLLRRLSPGTQTVLVMVCCFLQLLDTDPLRARLALLTSTGTPSLLDRSQWEARMAQAARVEIDPPYQCKDGADGAAQMHLQLAAVRVNRPINSVYNARLRVDPDDCRVAGAAARHGPWRDDTLYVFLTGVPNGPPSGWVAPRRFCHAFPLGEWCLGPAGAPGDR